MIYLFRYPGSHRFVTAQEAEGLSSRFITTQDPEYCYDLTCGHCDYPIEADDTICPRCQRELEECPVCSHLRHHRSPKVNADPVTKGKTCPVCSVTRIPFGSKPIFERPGSFCTNIYRCPAGGLLLKSEEFAVLKPDATLCPICKDEHLRPLDLAIFQYLVSICHFCTNVFGSIPKWSADSPESWPDTLPKFRAAKRTDPNPCPICGRNDSYDEEHKEITSSEVRLEKEMTDSVPIETYLRVAELARILIIERDDRHAFDRTFKTWFSPLHFEAEKGSKTVGEIIKLLLEGTVRQQSRESLAERLAPFEKAWKKKLPDGLNYVVRYEKSSG